MSQSVHLARLVSRPRGLIAACVVAVAAVASVLLMTQASAQDPYAAYPVLNDPGPSGLTVIGPNDAATSQGPVWVEGVGGVDIASAHEATVSTPGLRVWVAKRTGGGICVLALKSGRKGPASSCAPTSRGATIELLGAGPETLFAGVAPSDVTSVTVQLADGSTTTAPVSDNAYTLDASAPIESVSYTSGGTAEQITVGGAQ